MVFNPDNPDEHLGAISRHKSPKGPAPVSETMTKIRRTRFKDPPPTPPLPKRPAESVVRDFAATTLKEFEKDGFYLYPDNRAAFKKLCIYAALSQRARWARKEAMYKTFRDLDEQKDYLRKLDRIMCPGKGILLTGGVGTGKTTVVEWINSFILHSMVAVREVERRFRTEGAAAISFFSNYWNEDVIIDDLGIEFEPFMRDSKYMGQRFEMGRVLDARYDAFIDNRRTTIITTNLSKEDISARYGQALASRLAEMTITIPWRGEDFRTNGTGLARRGTRTVTSSENAEQAGTAKPIIQKTLTEAFQAPEPEPEKKPEPKPKAKPNPKTKKEQLMEELNAPL